MINFDFKILEEFLKENCDFLNGAFIRKIQQPSRQELIFGLRNNGENRKFYININPQFFHICFITDKTEKMRDIVLPQKPPMFCMLLRKFIENSKIIKVNQPKEERILEFYFKTINEFGEEILLCLAIELMGKHSNVVLYSFDTNLIIGCAHNVGSEKSRERELYGGMPYVYPPKRKNIDFIGLSSKLTGFANEFIDNYYSKIQYDEKLKTLKNNLINKTTSELKKIKNTINKIQQNEKSFKKIKQYRKNGDLIMANLYNNNDFQDKISVIDYETQETIEIELDKTKTLKENANRYYKLYNKGKTSRQKNEEIISDLIENKQILEERMFFIENSFDLHDLKEISQENTSLPKTGGNGFNIEEIDINGYRVFVGKNNRQNDYIVSKLGRKEDVWFHTRNCPGSHVLLRVEAGQEINNEILFECAKLAKENSAGENSSKVGVIYTRFKNIKKPPKCRLGYVIYKGETELVID